MDIREAGLTSNCVSRFAVLSCTCRFGEDLSKMCVRKEGISKYRDSRFLIVLIALTLTAIVERETCVRKEGITQTRDSRFLVVLVALEKAVTLYGREDRQSNGRHVLQL